MKKIVFLSSLFLFSVVMGFSQADSTVKTDSVKSSKPKKEYHSQRTFNFVFHYAFQMPQADLAVRFSNFSQLGFGVSYKTHQNFLFGIQGGYQWGGYLKEDEVIRNISTSTGYVIDKDGGENALALSIRSSIFTAYVGKIMPLGRRNPNSGVLIKAGFGYLQHKIAFTNQSGQLPQLSKDYIPGYERLTGGLDLHAFLGYYHMSMRKAANFYGGVTFDYARTNPLRDYDYSIGRKEEGNRQDVMIGIKFAWIIPIFLKSKGQEEFYYY